MYKTLHHARPTAAFENTEIPQKTKRESNRAHRPQDSRMR